MASSWPSTGPPTRSNAQSTSNAGWLATAGSTGSRRGFGSGSTPPERHARVGITVGTAYVAARIGAAAVGEEIVASSAVLDQAGQTRFRLSESRALTLKGV